MFAGLFTRTYFTCSCTWPYTRRLTVDVHLDAMYMRPFVFFVWLNLEWEVSLGLLTPIYLHSSTEATKERQRVRTSALMVVTVCGALQLCVLVRQFYLRARHHPGIAAQMEGHVWEAVYATRGLPVFLIALTAFSYLHSRSRFTPCM